MTDTRSTASITTQVVLVSQWVAFAVGVILMAGAVAGPAIGLGGEHLAAFYQRLFLFSGVTTVMHLVAGHRIPMLYAPAGAFVLTYLDQMRVAMSLGGDPAFVRAGFQTALLLSGAAVVTLTAMGALRWLRHLVGPVAKRTLVLLLGLALGARLVPVILGVEGPGPWSPAVAIASSVALVAAIVLLLRGSARWRPFAMVGMTVLAMTIMALFGWKPTFSLQETPWVRVPPLLAWGRLVFDPASALVMVATTFVLLVNELASVDAVAQVLGRPVPPEAVRRGMLVHGLCSLVAGLGAAIGGISQTSSAGLVAMSGTGSRRPVFAAALVLGVIGLSPALSGLIAVIPRPVAALGGLLAIIVMLENTLRDMSQRGEDAPGESLVLAAGCLLGLGLGQIPSAVLALLPRWLAYVVNNGILAGTLLAICLDHSLLRRRGKAIEVKV